MTICPHCIAAVAAGAAAPYAAWKLYQPVVAVWQRSLKANAGLIMRSALVITAALAAPVF